MRTDLSNEEQMLVNSELQKRGKSMAVAYVLAIFLGGFGIHRFYLGRKGSAIAMLVLTLVGIFTAAVIVGFILIAITGIWVIVDLFLIPGITHEASDELERKITGEVIGKRTPDAS